MFAKLGQNVGGPLLGEIITKTIIALLRSNQSSEFNISIKRAGSM
jgi:hypothetical protein